MFNKAQNAFYNGCGRDSAFEEPTVITINSGSTKITINIETKTICDTDFEIENRFENDFDFLSEILGVN